MPAIEIDGHAIANKIHADTMMRISELRREMGRAPKLTVLLVGDHKPSRLYVKRKKEAAAHVGIDFSLEMLPESVLKQDIIAKIQELQKDPTLSGLIVQLPLPEPLYTSDVLNAIDPGVDVDCLTDANLGKLVSETNYIAPPTPGAVIAILDELSVDVRGKQITIVGTGPLVGKPLAIMLMNKQATVTTCNSETKNLAEKCLEADILISAVGKKHLITRGMIKQGAIIIDSGVDFVNNQMFGDVDVALVKDVASYVTPTPGGVGPITVAKLLSNTAVCAKASFKR